MEQSNLAHFKEVQKQSWGLFAPLERVTIICAASLVQFARIQPGQRVLDVGAGTGVVAVTAARLGARVDALDLSPALCQQARINADLAKVEITIQEGDAEALPYPDHSFDAVLSQFGHMFAPRPDVVAQEMLRVLKPGGTLAFSTWPPELFVGRLFALVAKFAPAPAGVSPPSLWGDPHFVREHLGSAVEDLMFDQDIMRFPALSLGHYRQCVEETLGPVYKLVQESKADPARLSQFRVELESLASQYYAHNHLHQHYLMTRARKK